jgi:cytoskeletal protein CcmA (bactofilin family)
MFTKDPLPASQSSKSVISTSSKRVVGPSTPSIVSADMVITGTISSPGDIQIDGRIEGNVRSVGLVIGEQAEIHGDIYAENVTIRGKVNGIVHARKVILASTSRVEGDIVHEAFAVESGAFFEGNIRHSDDPLGDMSDTALHDDKP